MPAAATEVHAFPKDVKALIHTADEAGRGLQVLRAVESANEAQKRVLVEKIERRFGDDLAGRCFALWGLAFKPNTDDMREAPSRVLIAELLARGAQVQAYDPIAMSEARRVLDASPGLRFADSAMAALHGADALVIATEWKEFRSPDFAAHPGDVEATSHLRRSQHVRTGHGGSRGHRIPRHRPPRLQGLTKRHAMLPPCVHRRFR